MGYRRRESGLLVPTDLGLLVSPRRGRRPLDPFGLWLANPGCCCQEGRCSDFCTRAFPTEILLTFPALPTNEDFDCEAASGANLFPCGEPDANGESGPCCTGDNRVHYFDCRGCGNGGTVCLKCNNYWHHQRRVHDEGTTCTQDEWRNDEYYEFDPNLGPCCWWDWCVSFIFGQDLAGTDFSCPPVGCCANHCLKPEYTPPDPDPEHCVYRTLTDRFNFPECFPIARTFHNLWAHANQLMVFPQRLADGMMCWQLLYALAACDDLNNWDLQPSFCRMPVPEHNLIPGPLFTGRSEPVPIGTGCSGSHEIELTHVVSGAPFFTEWQVGNDEAPADLGDYAGLTPLAEVDWSQTKTWCKIEEGTIITVEITGEGADGLEDCTLEDTTYA